MTKLYKKVNKSSEHLDGFVEVTPSENPFVEPCFLCLSAQQSIPKSVFGLPKMGAIFSRVRVRDHYNGGLDIDSMPVSYLASDISDKESDVMEFVDSYFIPLLYKNDQRVDSLEACRIFRNINFLTYCDGTSKTLMIEECLNKRLIELGYSVEETNRILSSIVEIPIASRLVSGSEKFSVISFKDVRDEEVMSDVDIPFIESRDTSLLVDLSNNVHLYLYKGDGEHDLKKYALKDDVSAYISYIVTHVLENAVLNSKSDTFIPLDLESLISRLRELIASGLGKEEIMELIDSDLGFKDAIKLTKREALILDKYDYMSTEMLRTRSALQSANSELQRKNKQLQSLQQAVIDNCSDINALRILLEGLGWQVSKEQLEQIVNTPSDKEIIENMNNKHSL